MKDRTSSPVSYDRTCATVRRGTLAALALPLAALLVGCDIDLIGGGGGFDEEPLAEFIVMVTNVGAGSGTVDVTFSSGSKQNACPDLLGPGESCAPFVRQTRANRVESATVIVSPGPGSAFTGWQAGPCAADPGETECTVSQPDESEVELELRFDPSG